MGLPYRSAALRFDDSRSRSSGSTKSLTPRLKRSRRYAPIAADALRGLVDMNSVSPASRAVLILHFQEELPLADVAAILEIPLGTVKSRLAYGLAVLRRQLNDKRSP